MAKKNNNQLVFDENFAFYKLLWDFYLQNKGKIRSRYNDLTKKYLAYNDPNENPDAFLRQPQFEALEMYVFIKEFLDNAQMYKIFDEWRKREGTFSNSSYYSTSAEGQVSVFTQDLDAQNEAIYRYMEKFKQDYPNYIYALTMGLGKTILMATCIFYEFLLAKKYPKDPRFCHNALIFAPDKTVLQSLREIMTFDKAKVVPKEYVHVLDSNIKFHFLDDTSAVLDTVDGSDFNIVISNNQKIILKKRHSEPTAAGRLFEQGSIFDGFYDDEDYDVREDNLIDNQRFRKLCRLPQLGVYVDEAHHLFGSQLLADFRSGEGNTTTLRNTINLLAISTSIVACYNYTGTPYVNNQILPEVVYAYGLNESIHNGYLKAASLYKFNNEDIKTDYFLRTSINIFWEQYGKKEYEGLAPKLAIFAATVDEAVNTVRPIVENVLSELNIPISKILVNTGDPKVTKDEDIHNFNDLDVVGTEGSKKQFIILVQKGREGWNCRSLLGVAMFRSPKSDVFVLQATMRCLRKLTNEQLTASVFLSHDNYETLNKELKENYKMSVTGLEGPSKPSDKKLYKVHMLPPERKLKIKQLKHIYTLVEKEVPERICFNISDIDFSQHMDTLEKGDLVNINYPHQEINIDRFKKQATYSMYTLVGEISRYMNIPCLTVEKLILNCENGWEAVVEAVNVDNEILYDIIIPKIFNSLYEIKVEKQSEEVELVLLKEPEGDGYYEFSALDEMVVTKDHNGFSQADVAKSFHADTYCFDSRPEKKCFEQYITSDKVKEVYFTGMFTSSNQSDLAIQYIDPESKRLRNYYPDFLAFMSDGTCRLIEVKGENMINNDVVQAKKQAAEEIAAESGIKYIMYPGQQIMNHNVLDLETKEN